MHYDKRLVCRRTLLLNFYIQFLPAFGIRPPICKSLFIKQPFHFSDKVRSDNILYHKDMDNLKVAYKFS